MHVLQVVHRDVAQFDVTGGLAPLLLAAHLHAERIAQPTTRQRAGCGDGIRRAARDDVATAHAGPGTDVEHMVRSTHHHFVVFDGEHGVAEIAKFQQRAQQAFGVARVQANRRLIENVEHADQLVAELRRETNALRFAA